MNKFVFKTNFLFNNYYLQRKCLALKTPAAVNSNNFIDSEKSKVNVVNKHLNDLCKDPKLSRLYAVVMIAGSQFKVTTEDVITVRNSFYPTIGDKIRLEKVLLVGGNDFTFIGKPLLSKNFVHIDATVIEKTLTNDVARYYYTARKNNGKWGFVKDQLTMLRINNIDIIGEISGSNQKN